MNLSSDPTPPGEPHPAAPEPAPPFALERQLAELARHRGRWADTSAATRLALVEELARSLLGVFERWVTLGMAHKRSADTAFGRGQEWDSGPLEIVRLLAALRQRLLDAGRGAPRAAGPVRERRGAQGIQTVLPVFPRTAYDRVGMMNARAEVRLRPGLSPADLPGAWESRGGGGVALVLGAGNVSSICVTDTLEQLFVHDRVVLLKLNPVNAYLEPLVREGLEPLIRAGFVRVVSGGAELGAQLCHHRLVDHVHLTGSSATFDAIVFGPGEAGRKARGEPLLTKPVTAELGDVSPVIVVPGPWTAGDLLYQARHLASLLAHNAGFNCASPRLIVQHRDWPQRQSLMDALARTLEQVPTRFAYYPGASQRWQALLEHHPGARQLGRPREGELPWTLAEGVDPECESPVFEREPFCSFAAETSLPGGDAEAFLERAVEFANERLWGNLSVALLVHPASLRDAATRRALERAVDALRYGTVTVNLGTGFSWSLGVAPWGAYPGNGPQEVRSGIGFVHNPLGIPHIEKTVAYAPFRLYPDAPWFSGNTRYDRTLRHLTHLSASPSPGRLLALGANAALGWL